MTAPVSRPNLPPARHTRGRDQALWYRPVKVRGYMTTRAMASTACRATCVATTRAESRPGARAGRGPHGESGAVVRRGGTGAGRGRTGARLGSCRPGARGSDGARRGPKSTGALLGDQEVRLETRVYHPDVARGRPDRPRAKYRGSIFLFFPRVSRPSLASRHGYEGNAASPRPGTRAGSPNGDRTMDPRPLSA